MQSRVESVAAALEERAAPAAEAEARAAGAGAALERERQGRQAADLELLRAREQVARLEGGLLWFSGETDGPVILGQSLFESPSKVEDSPY